jgi:gliding motility-associated-like protein
LNQFNVPGATYSWTSSDGSLTTDEPQPTVTPTQTTTYNLVANLGSCSFETSLTIEVQPDIEVTIVPPGIGCPGDPVTLTAMAEPDVPGINYVWTNNSGGNGNGASITINPNETETWQVTASHTCDTVVVEQEVQVFSAVPADDVLILLNDIGDTIFVDTTMIYEGDEVELVLDAPSLGDGFTYTWLVGDVIVAETNNPTSGLFNVPEVASDYIGATFSVQITSPDGCVGTANINADILNNPVIIPNVFTPNGDGTNDTFAPVSKRPVVVEEFRIWSRWGDLIYESGDGSNAWDGNKGSDPAASDVYIYSFKYRIPGSDNTHSHNGDVTLLR